MRKVLTLVNTAGLPAGLELAVRRRLDSQGAAVEEVRRKDLALDLTFRGETRGWEDFSHQWQVDWIVQEEKFRRKKILISDMESTLVQNEFLDDLAEMAGVGDLVREITARAMNGELDFAGSLRARLALLRGQPSTLLERAWAGLRWMPGARELVAGLRQAGVPTIIVSGGFRYFTSRVCRLLEAERESANDLEIAGGLLTGHPLEPILGKESKRDLLLTLVAERGLALQDTAAVGDGANDLPLLLTAGLGVAFRAKPMVAAAAPCQVQYSDLRALLYIMDCEV